MKKNPTILVTGANGQLGSEFRRLGPMWPQFHFIYTDRNKLDIDDKSGIKFFFSKHSFDYCINCAAYTAVDKAETEMKKAFAVNADGPLFLAEACRGQEIRLIHISTDYVFDGKASSPYLETDATNPQSIYGESKLRGEQMVMETVADPIIIRSSWIYSEYGTNFVKTMLRLFKEKEELGVVNDQVGSPTYAADLATAILGMINLEKWQGGIYHYCNEGSITWYDFAVAIRDLSHSKCEINPISTDQYPTAAKRPAYSVLSTQKIRDAFGISIPKWKESLAVCIARMK